jgi:hypothetical protein
VMKSRGIKWPGHGDMRSTYRILVWTPWGKREPRKRTPTWEDNINRNLKERGCDGGLGWINLAQDEEKWRILVKTLMNKSGEVIN